MPLDAVTAATWADRIRQGIADRDAALDRFYGPVANIGVGPQANVLGQMHSDVRKVAALLSLEDASEFDGDFESDLDGVVFNEGLVRSPGGAAQVTLVFSRASRPTRDLPVRRGFAVATLEDEGGQVVNFVVTEDRTLRLATASSAFNPTTRRYELSVPAVAAVSGVAGRVGPNRVTRPLQPLVGFDEVTNPAAAEGGRDRETNQELVSRFLLAVRGRERSTRTGLERYLRDTYRNIEDLSIVGSAASPRAGETPGAVDIYILGEEVTAQVENLAFDAANRLIPLSNAPVVGVDLVRDLAQGITYVEGQDFVVALDASLVGGSARAVDGIQFLATAAQNLPAGPVTIDYRYDNLTRRVQADNDTDENDVDGRDELFIRAVEVPIAITYTLRVRANFVRGTVKATVDALILDFVNAPKRVPFVGSAKRLGRPIEESDLQGAVRQISGIDNFIVRRLSPASVASGISDIEIAENAYASLSAIDLREAP